MIIVKSKYLMMFALSFSMYFNLYKYYHRFVILSVVIMKTVDFTILCGQRDA